MVQAAFVFPDTKFGMIEASATLKLHKIDILNIPQWWAILLSKMSFGDDKEYASRKYYKPEPIHPLDSEPGVYNSLTGIFYYSSCLLALFKQRYEIHNMNLMNTTPATIKITNQQWKKSILQN